MSHHRTTTAVLVSVLVALAGFSGAVAATPATQSAADVQQPEEPSATVGELTVENLSTSMTLETVTLVTETDAGTTETTLESATVELTDATVSVTNATLSEGTIDLTSASVMVTDGTIEITAPEGDRTIDLEDTSARNRSVELTDLAGDVLQIPGDLEDATIRQLSVADLSGSADVRVLAMNGRVTGEFRERNVSVSVQNGTVGVEGGSVTLENATVDDGVITAERVDASASSLSLDAERLVLLDGLDLTVRQDVSVTAVDQSVTRTDVELSGDSLVDLLLGLGASAALEEPA